MTRSEHSDTRYEATRQDVWRAVGLADPHLKSSDPDPFDHNEHPWTEFLIRLGIAEHRGLPGGAREVGRVLKLNRLQELLTEMVAEGSLIALPRHEWAARGRESESRAKDLLYAHPALVKMWDRVDAVQDSHDHP